MRLNGWQRLGIVAFVIWALVTSVGLWREGHGSMEQVLAIDMKLCPSSGPKFDECTGKAWQAFLENLHRTDNEFWQLIPFVITIPALLVWGLISVVIVTVRWVRKGFA